MYKVVVVRIVVLRILSFWISYLLVAKLWKNGLVFVLIRLRFLLKKRFFFLKVLIVIVLVIDLVRWFVILDLVVLFIFINFFVVVK